MTNTELRNRTKIEDAVTRIKSLKFQCAGHVARAIGQIWYMSGFPELMSVQEEDQRKDGMTT